MLLFVPGARITPRLRQSQIQYVGYVYCNCRYTYTGMCHHNDHMNRALLYGYEKSFPKVPPDETGSRHERKRAVAFGCNETLTTVPLSRPVELMIFISLFFVGDCSSYTHHALLYGE